MVKALAFLALVSAPLVPSVRAQDAGTDRVTLQPKESHSRITVRGQILDYTGKSIVIETSRGQHEYPAAEVVAVETRQTPKHIEGLKDFTEGSIGDAQTAFEAALESENRAWLRREILAMLVRCALWKGDYALAGSRFSLLYASDPTTRHFRLIPLVWAEESAGPGVRNVAADWLNRSSPVEQLLGAGALLNDGAHAAEAQARLKMLALDSDPRISRLAEAQTWRLRVKAGDVADRDLERWQWLIDGMPEELRGGPYYVLGQAFRQRQASERAAASLLWLPLVYDHDRYLAARACLEAGDALAVAGQTAEAVAAYTEVAERFADTPFAQEAGRAVAPNPQGALKAQ